MLNFPHLLVLHEVGDGGVDASRRPLELGVDRLHRNEHAALTKSETRGGNGLRVRDRVPSVDGQVCPPEQGWERRDRVECQSVACIVIDRHEPMLGEVGDSGLERIVIDLELTHQIVHFHPRIVRQS